VKHKDGPDWGGVVGLEASAERCVANF